MSEKVTQTIPEMVENRDRILADDTIIGTGVERYAAAVTAAERLAKALARMLIMYNDDPQAWLSAPHDASALLDELYPGWRETT